MFDSVRADLEHARVINGLAPGWVNLWVKTPLHPGVVAVLTHRLSAWARHVHVPVARQLLLVLALILRRAVELVTGVEISPRAEIGPGLVVHTTHGVFIAETRIGRNCVVQHGVAITHGVRSVGHNVYFGPGAKVIGRAAVGDNVRVVANSVVMTDVGDNLTVVGVPARIRWRNRATLATAR
ncbi:MAG TPA: serine acetyltransferase [Methylomirabilota bacterium]|nr:serine acetyltransferase [Methylomirabilota bacterium]